MKNKKFLKALAAFMLSGAAAVGCFSMFGCGHSHTFSEKWVNTDPDKHWHEATCEHSEERGDEADHDYDSNGKCVVCDYRKPQPQKHQHVWASEWSGDENEHWKVCTDPDCDNKTEKGEKSTHTEQDGECIVCHRDLRDAGVILAEAKTAAKAELAAYKDADDYTANAAVLTAAITAGNTAIDAATTTEEVATALANAKTTIDAIKTDEQLNADPAAALEAAKSNAKATLAAYKNASDYTTNATALTEAITAGNTAIDAAMTAEEVATALANAKTAIDAIKSDATLEAEAAAAAAALATAKTNAKTELAAYKNASDYTTNATALAEAITAGNAAIDAATTTEGVATALANAKTALDAIKSDAELSGAALAEAKTAAKTALAAYKNAEDYTTNADALTAAIAEGNEAIEAATTTAEVDTALANAKAVIDEIKSDATIAEEAAAALATAKSNAKTELANYKTATDYTINAADFEAKLAAGNTAIDEATTTEAVATALASAKTALDAIKPDSQFTMHDLYEALGGTTLYDADFATDAEVPYWTEEPTGNIVGNISATGAEAYTEANKVEIKEGNLQIIDTSAETTYAYVLLCDLQNPMTSMQSCSIVNVYAKLQVSDNAGSWSLFTLIDPERSEIISVRSPERGKLGLIVDGTASTTTVDFTQNTDIEILISVDLANGEAFGYINGTRILFGTNGTAKIDSDVAQLLGIRMQTAGSASRSTFVSVLETSSKELELPALKEALSGRLTAIYESYDLENDYKVNGTTLTAKYKKGLTDIEAAQDKAGAIEALSTAIQAMDSVDDDAAVALAAAKQSAIERLNSYKTGEKYETNQTEVDERISNFVDQITYINSEQALENLMKEAIRQIRPLVSESDVTVVYKIEGEEGIYYSYNGYSGDVPEPLKTPVISGKNFLGWYNGEEKYVFPETWEADTNLTLTAKYAYMTNDELHANVANSVWLVQSDADTTIQQTIKETQLYSVVLGDLDSAYAPVNPENKSITAPAVTLVGGSSQTTFTKGLQSANVTDNNKETALRIEAKENITVYAYVGLGDSKWASNRTGNINYVINGNTEEIKTISTGFKVETIKVDLRANDVIEIYISNPNNGSRLWLFGVEATYSNEFSNMSVVYYHEDGTSELKNTTWSTLKPLTDSKPDEDPVPSQDGYAFIGWTLEKGSTDVIDLATYTAEAGSTLKLYPAMAEPNVTITYNIGEEDANSVGYYIATGKTGVINKVTDPIKIGYKFLGWYESAEPAENAEPFDFSAVTVNNNVTLYAVFVKVNKGNLDFPNLTSANKFSVKDTDQVITVSSEDGWTSGSVPVVESENKNAIYTSSNGKKVSINSTKAAKVVLIIGASNGNHNQTENANITFSSSVTSHQIDNVSISKPSTNNYVVETAITLDLSTNETITITCDKRFVLFEISYEYLA